MKSKRGVVFVVGTLLLATTMTSIPVISYAQSSTSPPSFIQTVIIDTENAFSSLIAWFESLIPQSQDPSNPSGQAAAVAATQTQPAPPSPTFQEMQLPSAPVITTLAPTPPTPPNTGSPVIVEGVQAENSNIFALQSAVASLTRGMQNLTTLLASQTPSAKIESQIAALQTALSSQTSAQSYNTSAYVPLGDGAPNTIAAASNINTIPAAAFASLTASEIPDLSGRYLSLSGGTLTGVLNSSSAATSTFAGGINITAGCFSVNGTCISGSGGSGTVGSGTQGQFAFYNAAGTTLTATSSLFLASNGNIGIGTTTLTGKFTINDTSTTTIPLVIDTDGSPGNYTATSSGIFMYDASGAETLRIVATDPDGNNYNSQNLFFGAQAGANNPSDNSSAGYYNTGVGYQALFANTTGYGNTANGDQALFANATGTNNTANGYQALYSNTSGSQNIANGVQALFSNTTGQFDNAFGAFALFFNTTGSYNNAFGRGAENANTTGSQNSAFGNEALRINTTGSNNVAIGYYAERSNLSATNTVAIGYSAGDHVVAYSNQGGTLVGYQAGLSFGNNSDYNTLFGYQAGYNITTGSNNLILATATSSTGIANLTTGSQNILIGNNISLPSATANGQLNIGNIIYGTSITGTGSTLSSGSIGIGTTTADSKLSIFASAKPSLEFSASASTQWTEGINTSNGNSFEIASSTALGTNPRFVINGAGNVGIGTTTPYSRLEVFGADAASSTSAFAVVNTSSTTLFAVYDGGNAQLSGTLTQSSDQRLKTNIQDLDGSSSLAKINALHPITFNWIDPNQGDRPQLGFIAQQVQGIFPNLVSTTSATALTPDGTLGLNYIDLISPIVAAIQQLSREIASIESAIAGFAQKFTTNELCVGSTCVTPQQFAAMVNAYKAQGATSQSGIGNTGNPPPSGQTLVASSSPIIHINGDNPAIIKVGASYSDLGATITGPQADLNLGIATYLNGVAMNPLQIDTSTAATDTIDYVVTDTAGNTSTSTRTVIIEVPTAPSQTDDASSSSATSTAHQ